MGSLSDEERRLLRSIVRQLRAIAKELDEWQDESRTLTGGELSKEGPGWVDF